MTVPIRPFVPSPAPAGVTPLTAEDFLALEQNSPTQASIRGLPAINPNLLARLFGGADPLHRGLLSADQANSLGRQSLLDTGLAILAASGPNPYRRGFGEILASGVQAGRTGFDRRFAQGQEESQLVRQQQASQALGKLRERYAGKTDIPSLTAFMHDLIGLGTPEALAGARALSEYLKSANTAAVRGIPIDVVGSDGKPATQIIDPTTGRPIGSPITAPPKPVDPLAQDRLNWGIAKNFEARTVTPMVRKQIDSYHQFQSHFREAIAGNPTAYKSLVSAFITNAEPNNQLRLGMLHYLEDVDPSLKGRAEIVAQRFANGEWPPAVLAGMQKVVEDNFRQVHRRYSASYQAFAREHPAAAAMVPEVDPQTLFGLEEGDTVTSAPRSARDRLRGTP